MKVKVNIIKNDEKDYIDGFGDVYSFVVPQTNNECGDYLSCVKLRVSHQGIILWVPDLSESRREVFLHAYKAFIRAYNLAIELAERSNYNWIQDYDYDYVKQNMERYVDSYNNGNGITMNVNICFDFRDWLSGLVMKIKKGSGK